MRTLIRIAVMILGVVQTASLFAGRCYYQGPDGGNWGEPANWSGKALPGTGDIAEFAQTEAISVNVDGDYAVLQVIVGDHASVAEKRTGGVTFTGNGKVTQTSSILNVASNANMIVDGPTFSGVRVVVRAGAALTVKAGGFDLSSDLTVGADSGDSDFSIDGGLVSAKELIVNNASAFEMTGGELRLDSSPSASSVAAVSITGGSLCVGRNATKAFTISDIRFLPAGSSAILSAEGNRKIGFNYLIPGGGLAKVGGTLVADNVADTAVSFSNADANDAPIAVGGRGTVRANTLNISGTQRTDFSLENLTLGSSLYPAASALTTRADFLGGVNFGAFGNWSSGGRTATINLHGDVVVDTDDPADDSKSYDVVFENVFPQPGMTLLVKGKGSVTLSLRAASPVRLDGLTVAENATLSLSSGAVVTKGLEMGAGATLNLSIPNGNVIETTVAPQVAATAQIVVTMPAEPVAKTRYPILVSATGDGVSDIPVSVANPISGWTVARTAGCIYLTDGQDVEATQATCEWRGGTSGNWNDGANWTGSTAPVVKGDSACFSGSANTVVTNDVLGLPLLAQMRFLAGGPYVIEGNPISLSSTKQAADTAAIRHEGALPLVVKADITSTSATYFGVDAVKDTYVELAGKTTVNNYFAPFGDVRVSGDLTCKSLYLYINKSQIRSTQLTVQKGGAITVSEQLGYNSGTRIMSKDVPFYIEQGCSIAFTGGEAFWQDVNIRHSILGLLDLRAPLGLNNATLTLLGSGRVNVASVNTYAGSTASQVIIGDGLHLCPASWETEGAAGLAVPLVVDTSATLLATNDWVYGVAEGVVPVTAAADRALRIVSPLATLTVDTEDPDRSDVAHTVTFADPVIGNGRLVKKGVGTLVLDSSENAIANGVEVCGGALRVSKAQTFSSLVVKNAELDLVAGEVVHVSREADLAAATLSIQGFQEGSSWQTILTVGPDAKVTGLPQVLSGIKVRWVGNALQAKPVTGFMLLFR